MVAFRSDEVADDHPLRRLRASGRLALEPLAADEVGALATTMAGALPESALEAIARLSGGNPFMATATLRGLVPTSWCGAWTSCRPPRCAC